ncbi:MAG: RraA family protein [Chloroflexi bacterium]|nr:RraA family protein [Chloroflexota bacterium]
MSLRGINRTVANQLSAEHFQALKTIDTPTVCNAIERFDVRGRVEGFLGMDIRYLTPELGTMVGYAITVTVDSTTPEAPRSSEAWHAWLKAMAASPKPAVLVFKDVGPTPRKSAHLGEVMGTIAKRLGVVGVVCDGGLRDILELRRLELHCFGPGLVPSHGNPRLIEVNVPVEIDGVCIEPGDLLHGDLNGVTTVPLAIADQVAEMAARIREEEALLLAYVNGPECTVKGLFAHTVRH